VVDFKDFFDILRLFMPFYNFCRKSVKKNYLNSCKKSSIKQDKYIEDKRIKALEKYPLKVKIKTII